MKIIIATGSYLPSKIVSNFDLAKTVDTTNEWIVERTGIHNRHLANEGELTSDLAFHASKKAMDNGKIKTEEIELIIVATTTPDLTFPSTATILQNKLNCKNAFAFDVQAVCSGFVYALNIANNFIHLIGSYHEKTISISGQVRPKPKKISPSSHRWWIQCPSSERVAC